MLPLLLVLQQAAPTVGDTVWLAQVVRVPAGVSVRPRPIVASASVEALGPPEVIPAGREVTVRYPVVFWRSGSHAVELPGVILVRDDGWSDTLRAASASVSIATVLPGPPADSIPPRPPVEIVTRSSRSALPALILLLLAGAAMAPLHWWWRRRGPVPAAPVPVPATLPDGATIAAWAEAGEWRAAAEAWAVLLDRRLAGRDDPRVVELIGRLRAARFGAEDHETLAALCREAAAAAGT